MTMNGKEATIENLVILEVVCNPVASLDEAGAHPEEFLRRITRLQRAFASPFETMGDASLIASMHVLRVTFPAGKEVVVQTRSGLQAYLRAMGNVERLSEEMVPHSSAPLTLSAGMESGTVFRFRDEPFGATANAADAFASEAHRTGVALVIGWSLFKAMKFDACLQVAPKTIRVTGDREREIVALTKLHLSILAEG